MDKPPLIPLKQLKSSQNSLLSQTVFKDGVQAQIGPYNPEGYNKDFIEENNKYWKNKHEFDERLLNAQYISPVVFGNPGQPHGAGLYSSLEAGLEVYSVMEGGLGLYNLGKGTVSAFKTYRFAKSTFEGGKASLKFTFSKEVLKYTGPEFYKFNRQGLSFTTNYATKNSVDVYNNLALGFKNGKSVNGMKDSYTVYRTIMKGFYLSGKIAGQGPTIGGAAQFIGFRGATIYKKGLDVGKTTMTGSSLFNWFGN
jgi:hypothetical protein